LILLSNPEGDVDLLELVETGQDTSTSDTTEDVGASALHHGHEALVLEDLHTAVDGALVLDGSAGGHHHTTPDGVDGVGHEAGADGYTPTQEEGQEQRLVVAQEDGFEGVVHAEVHATVDEDADAGDGEATVQALDTVGLEGLPVDVDKTVVLALTSLALGIVSQPSTGVIERVHKHKGERTSETTRKNILRELFDLTGILGGLEHTLDGVLKGKVQGLGWEVPEHISQVTSPEGEDTLGLQGPANAVSNTGVGLVQATLLDHLILVLDQQFDSLDGSSGGLGDGGSHTRQHKVFGKSKLLILTHFDGVFVQKKSNYSKMISLGQP